MDRIYLGSHPVKRTLATAGLSALLSVSVLTACSPGSNATADNEFGDNAAGAVSIVGFAVPKAAHDAVQAAWEKTADGQGVRFESSYGASGDQSRAVAEGKKADYVHFSLEGDVTRLVKAGLVDEDWNSGPTRGIISSSVVVLVVRDGNPKNIRGWDDIVEPGVGIVTANPGSSGAARWNILAAWAHAIEGGGGDTAGEAFLTRFFENAVTLAGSGREATTAFQNGVGDVLVSYENEAIFARQSGEAFDYLIPDTTLRIDNPAAVTKGANPAAAEYHEFILSEEGQRIFASKGFRPVIDVEAVDVEGANDSQNPFPTDANIVTIADLGGWSEINTRFFATKDKDGADGLITRIQNASGKGTT